MNAPLEPAPVRPAMHSPTIAALAAALAAAQAEFRNPEKNREVTVRQRDGGTYKFAYATLDAILDIVRQPLSKNGLVVIQLLNPDKPQLITRLLHSSGEWIESLFPLEIAGAGNQAVGSAVTYARRYALIALLGLAAEEDDDGNHGDGHEATGQDRQRGQNHTHQREAPRQQAQQFAQKNAATTASAPVGKAARGRREFNMGTAAEDCSAWFKAAVEVFGKAFADLVWKAAKAPAERFTNLRDLVEAADEITRRLGAAAAEDLINRELTATSMDEEGAHMVRMNLQAAVRNVARGPVEVLPDGQPVPA